MSAKIPWAATGTGIDDLECVRENAMTVEEEMADACSHGVDVDEGIRRNERVLSSMPASRRAGHKTEVRGFGPGRKLGVGRWRYTAKQGWIKVK